MKQNRNFIPDEVKLQIVQEYISTEITVVQLQEKRSLRRRGPPGAENHLLCSPPGIKQTGKIPADWNNPSASTDELKIADEL